MLKQLFFNTWRKAFHSEPGRSAAAESLGNLLNWRPLDRLHTDEPDPYFDTGRPTEAALPTHLRDDLIFISARFRSGSTLLWNLFRNVPGCVSYYEPLNERKWFDPQTRGDRVDGTHREVDVYWKEYDGLQGLAEVWDDSWPEHHLYLAADAWQPGLKRYIELLCEQAAGRPVLQFNRVDLRLPWLTQNFPQAKIVHLYRHPRDQWLSVLQDKSAFPASGKMADFAPADKFYTRPWAQDLKYHFPFLDERYVEHPYELHYLLWKLSYLYGRTFGDVSLSFEALSLKPEQTLFELFQVVDIDLSHIEPLLSLIKPPPFGKWRDYASDDWFKARESRCENVLREFLGEIGSARQGRELQTEVSSVA